MVIISIDANKINLEENKAINLCLGFFDGVHLGHAEVIKKAVSNGLTGVMSFDLPPHFALGMSKYDSCLTSLEDKSNLLDKMGVKYLYILRMSKELLNISRDDFVEKILKKINPHKIYCGEDYRFGKEAKGTPTYLSTLFNTEIVPLLEIKNKKVSSSDIANLIREGYVEEAKQLLGRSYQMSGVVVRGKGNGTSIGFPTANIKLEFPYVLPKIGVYYGYACCFDKEYKSLICVSTHPTIMELKDPIIEVHILNFDGDIYGKEISIMFDGFIREISKFKNVEELKAQIVKDIVIAKNALK